MSEKCSKCGGPVEYLGEYKDPPPPNAIPFRPHALPDTLERIEAAWLVKHDEFVAAGEIHTVGYWQARAWFYEQALTRLFQGCAECERKSQYWQTGYALVEGLKVAKRQAFLQAAEMVDELRPNLIGQASQAAKALARNLRQLAEEV